MPHRFLSLPLKLVVVQGKPQPVMFRLDTAWLSKRSLPSATNYPDHQPWLCRRYCDQILMHFHHQLRAFIRPSSRLGIRAATISLRPPPMLILQLLMAAPRLSTSSDRLARPKCIGTAL